MAAIEWAVRGGVAVYAINLLYRSRREGLIGTPSALWSAFVTLYICFAVGNGPLASISYSRQ